MSALLLVSCGGSDDAGMGKTSAPSATELMALENAKALRDADNVIVRNSDSGVSLHGRFYSFNGYLQKSQSALLASEGSASATFAAPAGKAGYYEVFVWWPQKAPAGSAAQVEVRHADGTTGQVLDQSTFGGQWNSLGTFRFDSKAQAQDAAQSAGVVLASVAGSPLVVDAVRFHYQGLDAPALTLRSLTLPVGAAGNEYQARIEASGGTAPYKLQLGQAPLPAGLKFDPQTGVIQGLPAVAGSFPFSIVISDGAGRAKTETLTLQVTDSSASVPAAPRPLDFKRESVKDGPPSGAAPDLGSLLSVVSALPEGEWSQVSLNAFSEAWAPPQLRPLFGWGNPAPDRILAAWSSVAWDPNRGQLILYGGGHANYRGNDVYLWKGATRRWERGALPSETVQDNSGYWAPVDGTSNAPPSAHTYDNNVFLPIIDRFLTLGGAAEPNGGHFTTTDNNTVAPRHTGPYLFDPARADPNKVGGTTGSHVKREGPHPEIVGGQMWQNRENFRNASQPGWPWWALNNGCTAYAREGGKDVVYVRYGVNDLYRYTINSLYDTTQDTWERVGVYWGGPGAKATCGIDPVGKTFLRTATNSVPFVYWDLNTPGPNNHDVMVTPADPGGQFTAYMASGARDIADCGMDFDPKRGQYALWCGDGRVWMLKPPATPSPTGWVVTQQRTPLGAVPNGDVGTGILGKWKYIDNLDVFLGVQDIVQGNIWLYKPAGWQNPGGPATTPPPPVAVPPPVARPGMRGSQPAPLPPAPAPSGPIVNAPSPVVGSGMRGARVTPLPPVFAPAPASVTGSGQSMRS